MDKQQRQRQRALDKYSLVFYQRTNNGRIFADIESELDVREKALREHLTDREKEERRKWAGNRTALANYFTAYRMWKDLSLTEMLLLPVAPPLLTCGAITDRSTFTSGRGRCYPVKIYNWKGFENEVRLFELPEMKEGAKTADVLYASLDASKDIDNESDEATYLVDHMLVRLQNAGLLIQGSRTKAAGLEGESREAKSPKAKAREAKSPNAKSPKPRAREAGSLPQTPPVQGKADQGSLPVLGNADRFLIAGQNTVPIEFKATHNLLLPERAAVVVRRYNKAVKEVNETQERTIDWVNIGHSFAQLVHYMVDAQSGCGVLSSGTRSYFVKVEKGPDNSPQVFISNAWFIGQKDGLRAWAYIYHLATGKKGHFDYPANLKEMWVEDTPEPERKRKDPKGRDGAGGSTDQGPSNDGPSNDGPSNDGPSNAGPSNAGPSNGGPSNEGPSNAGPSNERPSKRRKRDGQDCGAGGPPTEHMSAWLDPNAGPTIFSTGDSTDTLPSTGPKRDDQDGGAGGPRTGQKMTWLDSSVSTSIPRVAQQEIQILRALGGGNHLVYPALWRGLTVAVKAFDLYKDFARFEKEIEAYEHLKDAWGVLVPKPYFIADLSSVVLLGMQLGRVPNSGDRDIKLERTKLFQTLRDEYDFDHLDMDDRNVIYLPDNGGTGPDRLVAIDLEAHKIRQQHGSG